MPGYKYALLEAQVYSLIHTSLIQVCSMLLIHLYPSSASALWAGTVGAGIGVCALYSNSISLLASYDLLTPSTVSSIGIAAAVCEVVMNSRLSHQDQAHTTVTAVTSHYRLT